MNEVSKKKCFIDFLDELRLFIEETPIFTTKKIRRSAVCYNFIAVQTNKFVCLLFEKCFQVRDFSFCITDGIGLTGVGFPFFNSKTNSVG
jgi:hypothetical protein